MADRDVLYCVKDGFAVPGPDGYPVSYPPGTLVHGDHPILTTHGAFFQRADVGAVEQATSAPGERRLLRLPTRARTYAEAVRPRSGHADKTGATVPHLLPPEHPDSPASPFAPAQPAAGVVADDVPDEQNPAGKPKAADALADPTVKALVEQQAEQTSGEPVDTSADEPKKTSKSKGA